MHHSIMFKAERKLKGMDTFMSTRSKQVLAGKNSFKTDDTEMTVIIINHL